MHKISTRIWMGTALLVALTLAAATLGVFGTGTGGTDTALRVTARWSYCLFAPAYAGSALATLFGRPFQPLAREGRNLGLAFASAHLVHIGLVAWLYHVSPRPPVKEFTLIFFGVALLFTYVLALFSLRQLQSMLPPSVWRLLRIVGMEYIAFAFLLDFLQNPFGHGVTNLVAYLPFAAVGCTAALLQICAYGKRILRKSPHAPAAASRQPLWP